MAGTSTVGGVLPQKVIVIRHPCLWEECEAALIAPTHGWFDNPFHVSNMHGRVGVSIAIVSMCVTMQRLVHASPDNHTPITHTNTHTHTCTRLPWFCPLSTR